MRRMHQLTKIKYTLVFLLFFFFLLPNGINQASAKEDNQASITLKLNRDFGFGMGGLMQGTFTLTATSTAHLQQVDFMIDGAVIKSIHDEPFQVVIKTSDYSVGNHQFQVIGYTDSGQRIHSAFVNRRFIPGSTTLLVVITLVGLVLIGRSLAYWISRSNAKSADNPVEFGYLGGALCPKCGEAFGIHWWSLRLGIRRYDRCSNCGKWSFIKKASLTTITEANEQGSTPRQPGFVSKSDHKAQVSDFQKALDDSRYDNG